MHLPRSMQASQAITCALMYCAFLQEHNSDSPSSVCKLVVTSSVW